MRKPAFSLIEVLISMSLMGVLISLGGQLYLSLQELHGRYVSAQLASLEAAHLQHRLLQDLARAEAVLAMDSVRLELWSHEGFQVSYERRDSCLLRLSRQGKPARFPPVRWKRTSLHHLELRIAEGEPRFFRLPIPLFPPVIAPSHDFTP